MATYVNDLRLKEIATGDESGTWGTSTNTNLELIGEALGFGTEGITTNADTHTTTVADGSTDPGRAMYLKYTGTLDSACTITIAPNTISRMQFIENGTSGSQNIIISQGSGANITIPPGDTKAVYLDGAGSGAAVVDAFASLNTVDLKVEDDLTVTDDASIGGDATITGTLGVSGLLTANANVTLAGTTPTLTIGDAGAEDTKIVFDGNAQDFYIALDDSADDLLVGLGSTVGTTPIISITEAGAVTLKNVGTGDDNPMSLTLQTSETDIAANDVLGKISFQAPDEGTGTDAILVAAAIQAISEGDFSSSSNATSLAFMTGASEAATSKMTLSSGGDLTLLTAGKRLFIPRASDAAATGSLYSPSDSDVRLSGAGSSAGELQFEPSSTSGVAMTIDSSGNLGLGVSTPEGKFEIEDGGTSKDILQKITLDDDNLYGLVIGNDSFSTTLADGFAVTVGSSGVIGLQARGTSSQLQFRTANHERMRIDASGNVGIGTTSPDVPIEVVNSDPRLRLRDNTAGGGADNGGIVEFMGHHAGSSDGSRMFAQIKGLKQNSTGGDTHGYLAFHTNQGSASTTEGMRLNHDGKLTVGSTTTQSNGVIEANYSGNAFTLYLTATQQNYFGFASSETGGQAWSFRTAGSGNYGSANGDLIIYNGSSTEFMRFDQSASTVNGDFNDTSDIGLKENITDTTDGLTKLLQLQPRKFDWKDEGKRNNVNGFIAQEVETVLPDEVIGDDYDEKNPSHGHKSINTSGLLTIAIKAIQEQQTIIEDLKTRITTLEG